MDAHRFDALTRSLGTGASRRGLGKYLGGLALAGGAGAHGFADAVAKKKHHKKKKKKDKKGCPQHCSAGLCCDGACVSVLTDRHNCGGCGSSCAKAQGKSCICTEKETCLNGNCEPCAEPRKICVGSAGDQCVDLQTDHDHCGFCGNICGDREACRNGQCVCSGVNCSDGTCCPAGYEVCIGNGIGCCPNNSHYCGNARCCPNGFTCGGSCGGECCA
jgi:hypothetical protein